MGSPVAFLGFQDAASKTQQMAGGFVGKILGSIAGVLLIIAVLKSTFYVVKVGQRGVLMRRGLPVKRKNGHLCDKLSATSQAIKLKRLAALFARLASHRRAQQVGVYKVKRPGIWVKFPGWYDIDKVNVQKRVQKITPFDADCPDGQYHILADMVTKVPCDDDGLEYADYPARSIIKSSEADDVFESWAGTTLLAVLESSPKEVRMDRNRLFELINYAIGHEFDEVGYKLEGVNLRQRSLTPIQKAINAFAPQPASPQVVHPSSGDNVVSLPHAIVTAASLGEVFKPS